MRREVLRMDLGQPDGVNVAEELAHDRAGPDPPAVPARTGSGGEIPVRSRYGAACGSGCETAPAVGAGFGWRGSRAPAPPPRPR